VILTIRQIISINQIMPYDRLNLEIQKICKVDAEIIKKAFVILRNMGELVPVRESKAIKRIVTMYAIDM